MYEDWVDYGSKETFLNLRKKMNIKRLENKIFSKKSRYDLNKNNFWNLIKILKMQIYL